MDNQLPKLKTYGGVRALLKMVKELRSKPDGQDKLGLTLLFISASKVLGNEYKKSLMEKVTQIFDRK